MKLKYGMNPNQEFAELVDNDDLKLLNGNPSIINVLDALYSWQLVKELDEATGAPAATSFKHVTPSGAAIGTDIPQNELQSYHINKDISSLLAKAYIKARASDRLASFGDFIATSRPVDAETAAIIRSEVSDGIIAPGYDDDALEILKTKKKGGYVIFQINKDHVPEPIEERTIFGFTIKQQRNDMKINESLLTSIVTKKVDLSPAIIQNLLAGMITLKYTQSNSICAVSNGHAIGIGSGQQSRILCTDLALTKANKWYQKTLLDLEDIRIPTDKATKTEKDQLFEQARERTFGSTIKLNELPDLCLCSDAFFPQTDNIELAHKFGVKYIASTMGSIRDNDIIEYCEKVGITFINTGVRLFHH